MTTSAKRRRTVNYKPFIKDFLVCSKNELAPFATAFVYHPENVDAQSQGVFFGILKIDDTSHDSSYVTNLLASVMKKEYYSKPQRTAEESFEASLRKANLALAELIRHGSMSWAGKINFAGGSLERNNLHFSCLGNTSIYLIRSSQIVEISKDIEEEKISETHPLKTFANISSGKLEIGDKLIFATRELSEIFSPAELRQNAQHFSSEEFPNFLEISLNSNSELASVIILDLIDTAEEKVKYLASPVLGLEKIMPVENPIESREVVADTLPKHKTGRIGIYPHEELIARQEMELQDPWKKTLLLTLKIWLSDFKKMISKISRKIRHLALEKKDWKEQELPTPAAVSEKPMMLPRITALFRSVPDFLRRISSKKTNLLKGLGIALVALIIIISLLRYSNRNTDQPSENNPVSSIQSPSEMLAASDINVKKVESLEKIAYYSQEAGQIAFMDGNLYAASGKTILKLDTGTKNMEAIPSEVNSGNFAFISAMPSLESIFILTDDKKIISFTVINKKFQENSIQLPNNIRPKSIYTFLTYLYIMDPEANQIYRFPRASGGFGEMQNWLKNGTDISGAIEMGINDDIFIAGNNEIIALLQGKIDPDIKFENPVVELSADNIYTEPGFSGIYVFDSKNMRIIHFDKSGKIIAQYTNDSISSIRDFVVDEKNKSVYLLNSSNEIQKFSLE